jgi:hypothetical protein
MLVFFGQRPDSGLVVELGDKDKFQSPKYASIRAQLGFSEAITGLCSSECNCDSDELESASLPRLTIRETIRETVWCQLSAQTQLASRLHQRTRIMNVNYVEIKVLNR